MVGRYASNQGTDRRCYGRKHVVSVPANCTDRLQPMDLSVNKPVKDFMRSKFRDRYSAQVQNQLDEGEKISPVDLKMSGTWSSLACQPLRLP